MRIPRIYTASPLHTNDTIYLNANASIHIRDVLRLKLNAKVILFNGDGCDYFGEITHQTKKKIEIFIVDHKQINNESKQHIQLLQPLCRAEKMDWCIQKATELGVKQITPVICERSNVKIAAHKVDKKLNHWQSIIHSACEQSGRAIIPKIDVPTSLENAITNLSAQHGFRIISAPGASQGLNHLSNQSEHCICLVGPEGGFSDDELALAKNHNFNAIRLGPRILRLETAVITTLSLLQSRWGDIN